jgi:hypothetical protein
MGIGLEWVVLVVQELGDGRAGMDDEGVKPAGSQRTVRPLHDLRQMSRKE